MIEFLSAVIGIDGWPDLAAFIIVASTLGGGAIVFVRWTDSLIQSNIHDELSPLVERVTMLEEWQPNVEHRLEILERTDQQHDEKLNLIDFGEEDE